MFGEDEGTNCASGDSDSNCDIVCIKCMKLIVQYFLLAEVFISGVLLRFGSIYFSLAVVC